MCVCCQHLPHPIQPGLCGTGCYRKSSYSGLEFRTVFQVCVNDLIFFRGAIFVTLHFAVTSATDGLNEYCVVDHSLSVLPLILLWHCLASFHLEFYDEEFFGELPHFGWQSVKHSHLLNACLRGMSSSIFLKHALSNLHSLQEAVINTSPLPVIDYPEVGIIISFNKSEFLNCLVTYIHILKMCKL